MIKLFFKLWLNKIKPFWSKIRWKSKLSVKSNMCYEQLDTIDDVKSMCKDVYNTFEWTQDGLDELFDSYRPVEYLYTEYIKNKGTNNKFKDDCDGFHSVIYHILVHNGYDAGLITIITNPLLKSHTMAIFKDRYCYYLVDYNELMKFSDSCSIQDIVDSYNRANSYKPEYYWNIQQYDYDTCTFYTIKEKE